jgi:hypothetical protein
MCDSHDRMLNVLEGALRRSTGSSATHANSTGLANRLGTTVISRLSDLIALL